MKTKGKTKKVTIDDKVKSYVAEDKKNLQKVGLSRRLVVLFPKQKGTKPNLISRIALAVLRSQGGILDTEFSEIKK